MNKIGKIVCCAVLCIPLAAAVIIGITSNNNNTPQKNNKPGEVNIDTSKDTLNKVKILAMDNSVIREYEDKEVLKMYSNAVVNGKEITDVTQGDDEEFSHFKVNYLGDTAEVSYEFVMSSDSVANCYFLTADEKKYAITPEDAAWLLKREEFADANKYANVVNLYLEYYKNSELVQSPIEADTYEWNYKRHDGEFVPKADNEAAADLVTVIYPKNGVDMKFSFGSKIAPDPVNMVIKNNGQIVYEGAPSEAVGAYLNFTEDTTLDVSVDATWHEGNAYHGNAKYNFKMLYDVPSNFKLVNTSLDVGEFTVINVTGGNISEKVTAKADFMAGQTESFVYEGKQLIYIPIKPDIAPGTYKITLTENAGVTELDFTVKAKTFGKTDELLPSTEITAIATESNIQQYSTLLEQYKHTCSEKQLWNDKFMNPVAGGVTSCGFGDTLNITGNVSVSNGMYISAASGSTVVAANNGIVLYAGETNYSGNTVIIDHGLGVISYYFNLGSIKCTAGSEIQKGTAIGTVGNTGYTPFTNTFMYANTVGGCFVNPATQIKYGIDLT